MLAAEAGAGFEITGATGATGAIDFGVATGGWKNAGFTADGSTRFCLGAGAAGAGSAAGEEDAAGKVIPQNPGAAWKNSTST